MGFVLVYRNWILVDVCEKPQFWGLKGIFEISLFKPEFVNFGNLLLIGGGLVN